ncbi:hypothetical protein AMATHDRAFT_57749 [Amanita thiersii Skay4041]|uniref:Clathrin/coatomer adaptor adaptin-like N-terminal domain-containing protein n=1 Tax=Amanita thiersii Skay4041 TaxID=703135 RepID=A0A2A9NNC2_9AGAR|nr:hypothetical protein AMATHDRAFT_57749 [Amanita thiersii Skay4041]
MTYHDPSTSLAFALPHAVSLTEYGKTIEDKRIGYHFCAQIMQPDDEFQLMLVNTLRKDLDSLSVARICLALETLTTMPNTYVIPAIQSRLSELFIHKSPLIRRRAIYACRSLSNHEPGLLSSNLPRLLKRLDDPDPAVVNAAFSSALPTPLEIEATELQSILTIIHHLAFQKTAQSHFIVSNALAALLSFGTPGEHLVTRLCKLVRTAAQSHDFTMLCAIFRLFPKFSTQQLKATLKVSPVTYLRDMLTSEDPNIQYLLLVCLESLDNAFWAGTTHDFPATLDEQEVGHVMKLVDSADCLIRKKTLSVLLGIDPRIVEAIYSRLLQSLKPDKDARTWDENMTRLIEVIEVKSTIDGEQYASFLQQLLVTVDGFSTVPFVSEGIVTAALSHIQHSSETFQIQCSASLLTCLSDPQPTVGPTMLVILSALATQFCGIVSIPPVDMLTSLASNLSTAPPPVQDACLLSMLRLAAECGVPEDIHRHVRDVYEKAGRYIRRRCEQFQSLSGQKTVLNNIVRKSGMMTLPNFLSSLETHETGSRVKLESKNVELLVVTPSKSVEASESKLRYAAYDSPRSTPKLRTSRPTSAQAGIVDAQANMPSHIRRDSKNGPLEYGKEPESQTTANEVPVPINETNVRMDLIAFDQPTEQPVDREGITRTNFHTRWSSLEGAACDMRGWGNATIEDMVRKLHEWEGMDVEVFFASEGEYKGEVQVTITTSAEGGGARRALVKLRESDEDGTLWRLRSEDGGFGGRLKRLLPED